MIYSVTFNPSLDVKVSIDEFRLNELNRYKNEIISPGGKGINVSLMLKELGLKNTAFGFRGGFTGEELIKLINKKIKTDFIKVSENTRINFKIEASKETEINGAGPKISDAKFKQLENKINKLKNSDILILAGSKPLGQPKAYKKLGNIAKKKNLLLIADTNNGSLRDILKFKPFLIKPNKKEAEEILNIKIKTKKDILNALQKFKKMGAENILLSLGGEGAYLYTSNIVLKAKAPKGKIINTIGSGDSMLAGFIKGFIQTNCPKESLKLAIAAGSASAFVEDLANKKEILKLAKEIKIEEIK